MGFHAEGGMHMDRNEAREAVVLYGRRLAERGLTVGTGGNLSVRVAGEPLVALKPSGVPYEVLTPSDVPLLDLEGRVVEGTLRPSSDTRTHLVLYRAFPGLGGIVHTHSTYATGWAQACRPIPILGTTHADHLAEDVPCTELMTAEAVQSDYETETGRQILACFQDRNPAHVPMVLVAGHGPFTWGETPEKAVYHAVVLEELAKMAFVTCSVQPGAARLPDHLVRKHFERKHGKDAYYGQGT